METLRVLVVDDDEDDYHLLRELLGEVQDLSLTLEWAATFTAGEEALAKKPFDLCFVDYRLGSRTGLEMIRDHNEKNSGVPFILLTGQGDHEVDIEAMKAGAEDYLVKGQINPQVLERTIRYSVHHARALKFIREREENFRNLLDSTFEGVIVFDAAGQISMLNRAAAQIFGYEISELIKMNLQSILEAGALQRLEKIRNHESFCELEGFRRDGFHLNLEVSCKTYHNRHRDLILCAIHDVTTRKQMEAKIQMQDRLASVGLLASSLAHEIGTPLGVIRGRAEFLGIQVKEAPEIKRNVEIILAQIDRVSTLIRSLLNLARGEHSQEPVAVNLAQIVQEVLDLMGHEMRKNSIAISSNVPADLSLKVRAESQPLHQVILNLLVNAVHAIETAIKRDGRTSGHFIRIEARAKGSECVLSVHDSGIGISEENLKKIFTPFFTTKDVGVGTGLGLATSYRIVESWGGSIRVESEEKVGTVFRIVLPRVENE